MNTQITTLTHSFILTSNLELHIYVCKPSSPKLNIKVLSIKGIYGAKHWSFVDIVTIQMPPSVRSWNVLDVDTFHLTLYNSIWLPLNLWQTYCMTTIIMNPPFLWVQGIVIIDLHVTDMAYLVYGYDRMVFLWS